MRLVGVLGVVTAGFVSVARAGQFAHESWQYEPVNGNMTDRAWSSEKK
jgi:hypothetical protein